MGAVVLLQAINQLLLILLNTFQILQSSAIDEFKIESFKALVYKLIM